MSNVFSIKEDVVRELHKPARKKIKRRKVLVSSSDDLYQADLVEMISFAKINKGFKYILMIINVFSKFVWAFPVKCKTRKDISNAMKKFLSSLKKKQKNIQTDMDKECYNKEF